MSQKKNILLKTGALLVALTGLTVEVIGGTTAAIAQSAAPKAIAQSAALKAIARNVSEPSIANNSLSHQTQLLAQNSAKPIRIVFPSRGEATEARRKADAVASFLSSQIGTPVEAIVSDETAAVEALRANGADVAFVSGRAALKASQLANARLYLAEVRPNYSGGHTYKSILVVRKDSPLKTQKSPQQTLAQLRGKRMAFASRTSGSGFIVPTGEFVSRGLVSDPDRYGSFFKQVAYGDGYSSALQAVLRGQADVGAVSEYALNAPYIKPEEAAQLRVLYAIPGVPAHGVAIDDDVPAATRNKLVNAMLKLNEPGNNQLLKDLGNATQLIRVEHNTHLNMMRQALRRAKIDP